VVGGAALAGALLVAHAGVVLPSSMLDLIDLGSPATMARLAAVKREWDPANVFCRNHNVKPGPNGHAG